MLRTMRTISMRSLSNQNILGARAQTGQRARFASVRPSAVDIAEHALYLEEVAVTTAPKTLPAFLRILEAQGNKLVSPPNRQQLHPLFIPLAEGPITTSDSPDISVSGSSTVIGLLRWPQPGQYKNMQLPVVSMSRGARGVRLIARSIDEQLHRLLAEEDMAGGERKLAQLAGFEGSEIYQAGQVEASGMAARMPQYLISKAGFFPDVVEGLAHSHLQRGDETSALVACEWAMKGHHFPGWGRPYEFAATIYRKIGQREEECRDTTRIALRMPWWTLRHSFAELQPMAQLNGSPESVRWQLSEEAAAAAQAQVNKVNFREPRTPQQLALENAAKLMDMVAAGAVPSYDDISAELAQSYKNAGLNDAANFIAASSS